MSLQLKTILISGFCLLVSACGFHPIYGDNAAGLSDSPLRGNLVIDPIGSDHSGQLLKIALEDRFNPEGLKNIQPEYHLHIDFKQTQTPSVVRSDGTILRYQLRLESTFKLYKTGVAKEILSGELRRFGSYNAVPNANFAVYEAEQDTAGRIIDEMAEDYILRISGYFAGKP